MLDPNCQRLIPEQPGGCLFRPVQHTVLEIHDSQGYFRELPPLLERSVQISSASGLVYYESTLHPSDGKPAGGQRWRGDIRRQCPKIKVHDAIGHTEEAGYFLAELWVYQGLETIRWYIIEMN